jgi:hypothetical protein
MGKAVRAMRVIRMIKEESTTKKKSKKKIRRKRAKRLTIEKIMRKST